MVVLGVLLIAALAVAVVMRKRRQAREDAAAGIVARFMDLRLTRTALLVGHGQVPLAGVTARVEESVARRSVFLTISGPGDSVLREQPYRRDSRAAFRARVFAEALNLRARQLT